LSLLRFGVVGAINTLVDFTVLNLLLVGLGVHDGVSLLFCNAGSFTVANLNSYLLNKRWTFADRSRENVGQFLSFLLFSLGGLVVNSLVLYLLTSFTPSIAQANRLLWINLAKIIATGASMVWNFLTYRHFVFRSPPSGLSGRNRPPGDSAGGRLPTGADSSPGGPNE